MIYQAPVWVLFSCSKRGDFMKRAILGEVEFSAVEKEDPVNSVEVTEKPVERGQDVADHVRPKPVSVSISGVVVGPDAAQKLEKLKQYQRTGQLLTYIGRNLYTNMVIEHFDTSHGKNVANGFSFSMVLKHIRIATAREVAIKNVPVKTQGATQKAGTKQTQTKSTAPDLKEQLIAKLRARG